MKSLVVIAVLSGMLSSMSAQQTARSSLNNVGLPDSPGMGYPFQVSNQSAAPQSSASISGTVLDPNGTAVPGAQVALADQIGAEQRVVLADDQGKFTFLNLPSSTFRITITAAGFKTFITDPIVLATSEKRDLPAVGLRVIAASQDVEVVASQEEVAQAQVKAAEKQRVLGIVPNFYSSYIWNAAPMNSKQKFGLALRSTTDPVEFMIAGATPMSLGTSPQRDSLTYTALLRTAARR